MIYHLIADPSDTARVMGTIEASDIDVATDALMEAHSFVLPLFDCISDHVTLVYVGDVEYAVLEEGYSAFDD